MTETAKRYEADEEEYVILDSVEEFEPRKNRKLLSRLKEGQSPHE